ncbi:UNVERIFIED_CONTAM: hypothetical protein HDU68_008893 [Siphonaria sp. JEL0065]|nr:hypothetical protein HDU68_008893 [Siphonaria sp. JEL0065]
MKFTQAVVACFLVLAISVQAGSNIERDQVLRDPIPNAEDSLQARDKVPKSGGQIKKIGGRRDEDSLESRDKVPKTGGQIKKIGGRR